MRVAMVAGASSIHTIRWANGLARAGVDLHLLTQHAPVEALDGRVGLSQLPARGQAGYFLMVPTVRRILRRLAPDVVSAHYASGYATTARLAGFHPWMLSVWGSDVYDYPERSPLHRWWLRRNLRAADRVVSTSHCMAERVRQLAPEVGGVGITPFGVDVEAFSRVASPLSERPPDAPIVVGTVKALAPKYGVDTFIRAFARLREELAGSDPATSRRLRLRIVGDGPEHQPLAALSDELGVAEVTELVGRVPHGTVPEELAGIDIFVALSRLDSESFGVAVLEAGAARRPVVVSDAGGLPEVVADGETGLIVAREDPAAAARAIRRLVEDPDLRRRMGEAGHARAARDYSWDASVQIMLSELEATRTSVPKGL